MWIKVYMRRIRVYKEMSMHPNSWNTIIRQVSVMYKEILMEDVGEYNVDHDKISSAKYV